MNPILKKVYQKYVDRTPAGKKPYAFGKWAMMRCNKISMQSAYGWSQMVKQSL